MEENEIRDGQGVALARVPVFDREQRLWGYEVRCVTSPQRDSESHEGKEVVLSYLASTAYIGLQMVSERGKKLIVSLDEKMILEQFPYALPPNLALIKVSRKEPAEPSLIVALEELKRDDYGLAVVDIPPDPSEDAICLLADVFCVLVAGLDRPLGPLVDSLKRPGVALMAVGVSDRTMLARCHSAGFDLYQGSYFKSPEQVPIRRLTTNEAARLRLLHLIENADPDVPEVAEAIQSDPALSFRLLAYLNSAAFGFRQSIKSIRQSITLLGWNRVKNWLRVALISDMAQGVHSAELVHLAAQRGKFLELIGERFDFWGFDPNALQLLGLFSLLDTILQVPMADAVEYLPLDAKMKAALKRDPNSEYYPLIQLAELYEEGRWTEADELVSRLGLDDDLVKAAFHVAVSWANQWSEFGAEIAEK
jgi:EAL and modified HD-GYP domain-containing signal transduction protein